MSNLYQWIQRIEQITENINTRLSAIERRFSSNENITDPTPITIVKDDLDIAISMLQETTSSQQRELEKLKKQFSDYNNRNHQLTMKIGRKEVSLEITGIIGGLLSFLVAGLLLIGGREIILSPVFLAIIGIIFISFSIMKPFYTLSPTRKIFHKTDRKPMRNP